MLKLIVSFLTFLLTGLWFFGVKFPYMDKIIGAGWILMALFLVL